MGEIANRFAEAFRDYTITGVPASGAYEPEKSIIRSIGALIEAAVANAAMAALVDAVFDTLAHANAGGGSLDYPAGSLALIYADPSDANNDIAIKTGASGSGSWVPTGIIHSVLASAAQPFIDDLTDLVEAVEQRLPDISVELGADLGGDVWGGTGYGVETRASPVPVPFDGKLESFRLYTHGRLGGAAATIVILNRTGDRQYQVAERFTVPVAATGIKEFVSGEDFDAVNVSAGQFIGVVTSATWSVACMESVAGFLTDDKYAGDIGSGATNFSTDFLNTGLNFTVKSQDAVASERSADELTALLDVVGHAAEHALGAYSTGGGWTPGEMAILNKDSVLAAGYISQIELSIRLLNKTGLAITFFVADFVSGTDFKIAQTFDVIVSHEGHMTFVEGRDFESVFVQPGQYIGFYTASSDLEINWGSGVQTYTMYINGAAPVVGGTLTFSHGGASSMGVTIRGYQPRTPYHGLRLGVWGHSLCNADNLRIAENWQRALCAELGMTWAFNDGVAGRPFAHFFENYGSNTLTDPDALSIGYSPIGGVDGRPNTSGTTLAQDMANVDVLIIWLGDNDIQYGGEGEPLGELGDTAADGTFYGYVYNALDKLFTAKPTLKIQLISHYQGSRGFGRAGYETIETVLVETGRLFGVPVIKMLEVSGINSHNSGTYLKGDGIHPLPLGWKHLVPIIAQNISA